MRILITNDDGIDAVGINVLAEVFCKDNDVYVVAPSRQRSACSHSITIFEELVFEKVQRENYTAYSVSGTPADCVKLGLLHLVKGKIDLVISGINNGSNLGSDTMYSGTVAAAFEGAYLGVRSIAISLTTWEEPQIKYREAANFLLGNLSALTALKLPSRTILNVNYPGSHPFKGVKGTKVGLNLYDDCFIEGSSPSSVSLRGKPILHDNNDLDCDVELAKLGFATVSPITMDNNDYASLKLVKEALKNI